jgi:hypothetical protein
LALVACGCLESGFGTSAITKLTKCPFNLQRPKDWKYPRCDLYPIKTFKDRENKIPTIATFCKATDLADATRLFCEWVVYYPNQKLSGQLMAVKSDAKAFAKRLPSVGFGVALAATGKNPGEEYKNFIDIIEPYVPPEDYP